MFQSTGNLVIKFVALLLVQLFGKPVGKAFGAEWFKCRKLSICNGIVRFIFFPSVRREWLNRWTVKLPNNQPVVGLFKRVWMVSTVIYSLGAAWLRILVDVICIHFFG